ncbi:MAG: alkyl hydroperoxide reductase subunit F [Candidatus Nanopelagicales bacterium]|nr:alkyl hydroperoxide reductase subunit F [Candidatus Nanopelagicales bacterium]
MLDSAIAQALQQHLEKVQFPIALIAALDESPKSVELRELLTEIAGYSPLITLDLADDERVPSFAIARTGTDISVRFAGIPMGHEFTSLVLALLWVGGHPSTVSPEVIEQIRALDGDYIFQTYMSLSCQNCPDVVQALNLMSVINPRIRHTAIDGGVFPDEIEERGILAVPTVYLDGEVFVQGRISIEQIIDRLDTGAAARTAATIAAKDPFDVLVVGGGPAGAAAAIYAARKGIRTGVVTERFGGQVLDTMAIENFVSMQYTEGPQLGTALEQHVNDYDVDVMHVQQAAALVPAQEPGGEIGVRLENGAVLTARSVILSTGARWRTMSVPGEDDYRNKGVTFCPHCDGPLFKGKRVAVIGGGNSGIEAAIDLAGLVAHVTVLEFDSVLRADEVLQRKLATLPNVTVIVGAATTQVVGDGSRVTGLEYESRADGSSHALELEGIFVQIGLLPNTEWLTGAVELSPRGEIIVDAAGATSLPGVFAAGDCTTVPYKQIVIALGAGATAALGAFDYLIRN